MTPTEHLAAFLHGEIETGWFLSYDTLHNQMIWGILDQRMPFTLVEVKEDGLGYSKGELVAVEHLR
jgi:hypothetical protein